MAGIAPRGRGIIEGINVTPLVDITLVLLVVFMVTAKIMTTPAIAVDLPKANQTEEIQTILSVGIDADGVVSVDGKRVAIEDLAEQGRRALKEAPQLRAVIQADGNVPHRRIISVLDRLREASIARVAFGALPRLSASESTPPKEGTLGMNLRRAQ